MEVVWAFLSSFWNNGPNPMYRTLVNINCISSSFRGGKKRKKIGSLTISQTVECGKLDNITGSIIERNTVSFWFTFFFFSTFSLFFFFVLPFLFISLISFFLFIYFILFYLFYSILFCSLFPKKGKIERKKKGFRFSFLFPFFFFFFFLFLLFFKFRRSE